MISVPHMRNKVSSSYNLLTRHYFLAILCVLCVTRHRGLCVCSMTYDKIAELFSSMKECICCI